MGLAACAKSAAPSSGVPACPARAHCLYVATSGSDRNPGTPSAPLQTVEAALARTKGGEIVYVRAGRYANFTDWPSRRSSEVRVIGYGDANGGKTRPVITSLPHGVSYLVFSARLIGSSYLTFENLKFLDGVDVSCVSGCAEKSHDIQFRNDEFTNSPASARSQACVRVEGGSYNIVIAGDHIHDCWTGVFGPGHGATTPRPHDIRITGNDIEHNADDGIQFAEWDNLTIDHNLIHDNVDLGNMNHEDGIQFVGLSSHVTIEDNVIHGTGQLLFVQDALGPIDDVLVQDNLMYGSAGIAIQSAGASNTRYIHNTVWDTRYAALMLRPGFHSVATDTVLADNVMESAFGVGGTNVRYEDYNVFGAAGAGHGVHDRLIGPAVPVFANPAEGDYHLRPGSPAIGAGALPSELLRSLAPQATDLDGLGWSVPPSAGAYEYRPARLGP